MRNKNHIRRLLLRIVRRLLREADRRLERAGLAFSESAGTSNGSERELDQFFTAIEIADACRGYVDQHRDRILRTPTLIPRATGVSPAVELGSYLYMSAALSRVLGYSPVRGAYFGSQGRTERKCLSIRGQEDFCSEIDLFDAERDSFPYSDGALSVILCALVEHLLRDPMHMLFECHRTLSDGGLLLVTTPNAASLTSVAAVLHGRHNPQVFSRYPSPSNPDTPHVREYTPPELSDAVTAAGFKVEFLFTERMSEVEGDAWVRDLLVKSGFDASLRGEQIYCLARKRAGAPQERYPSFLYVSASH